MEGLIFGGAYLRRGICVSKSNGLAFYLEVNLPFLLCFTLYLRAIFRVQVLGGAYIWWGDLTEGFLRYDSGRLIFGGAYFRNFVVMVQFLSLLLFEDTGISTIRQLRT